MLTKHSLDLRLARDLELGRDAREPHRPSMEGLCLQLEHDGLQLLLLLLALDRLLLHLRSQAFVLRLHVLQLRLPQAHQLLQRDVGVLGDALLAVTAVHAAAVILVAQSRGHVFRQTLLHQRHSNPGTPLQDTLFCTLLHASRIYSQKLRCPSELNQLPEPGPRFKKTQQ
ncbi:hypothetical protein EYF80_054862 [Liparis tanakae]|uniref:Uncharacterized protein n=1 Tax=Liparis tanakae TaxID=230148 RepID=A0A4Z2F195_9TELE|nr:hypothetical protein EYF80_054862 [Liparis tanakae]